MPGQSPPSLSVLFYLLQMVFSRAEVAKHTAGPLSPKPTGPLRSSPHITRCWQFFQGRYQAP